MKVNMDGAFPSGPLKGSIAYLCRNHNGSLIDGSSQLVAASSPLLLESDCLELVEAVNLRH